MVASVRRLEVSDDRSEFTCGDPDLDSFFRQFAAKNQFEYFIGTTYVAVHEDGSILGFMTVAPGALSHRSLRKAVGRGAPAYPLPVLRVARLGVAAAIHARGIGSALLGAAFDLAIEMSTRAGCAAVVVDAKPGAVGYYERFGFVAIPDEHVEDGEANARPRQSLMYLPTRVLLAARA